MSANPDGQIADRGELDGTKALTWRNGVTAVEVNALGRTTVYQFHPTSWWETGLRAGTWSFGGNFTPNAGYVTSNLKVVREQQAEAASRTAPQRQEIWRMLEQDRIDTERRMIARYGEEFRR